MVECIVPILRVENLAASVGYYTDVLGFGVDWRDAFIVGVSRDGHGIMLCAGSQGQAGTHVWIGVQDVNALHAELVTKGAKIRHAPENYPWAQEMKVEDLDGHTLRFGSEPLEGQPFVPFTV